MKKVSMIGLSFLAMIAVVTVFFFNSCTKDPCKDVVCLNSGTCVSGTCECTAGYEGTDCGTKSRDKFIKVWTSVANSCIAGQSTGQLTVTAGSDNVTMFLSNFGHLICGAGDIVVTATVTGPTTFDIASQSVCGTTYTGSGTLNGTTLNVTYTYDDTNGAGSGSCTDTYN